MNDIGSSNTTTSDTTTIPSIISSSNGSSSIAAPSVVASTSGTTTATVTTTTEQTPSTIAATVTTSSELKPQQSTISNTSSSTTTTTTTSSSTNSPASTLPAFWELDIPLNDTSTTSTSTTTVKQTTTTTTTSKKSNTKTTAAAASTINSQSSTLIKNWLQTQIATAVAVSATKIPLTTTTTTTTTTLGGDGTSTTPDQQQQEQQTQIANTLYQNLIKAVQSLRVTDAPQASSSSSSSTLNATSNGDHNNNHMDIDNNDDSNKDKDDDDDDDDNNNNAPNNRKRRKISLAMARKRKLQILHDPYHIWFQKSITIDDTDDDNNNNNTDNNASVYTSLSSLPPLPDPKTMSYWNDEQDDIPIVVGGKIAILSVGGIFNAMALAPICTTPILPHQSKVLLQQVVKNGTIQLWKQRQHEQSALQNVTIGHLHMIANTIHIAIAEQVKYDIVRTTPYRIQLLLASELTNAEFISVRRRLHDTVILGKGVQAANQNNANSGDENNDTALAVGGTTSTQQHAIDKYKKCPGCGNNDQSEFILDRKNGDLICANCGIVVSESIMHEGSQFRKFEGEVDRNHHGDASNPLYSNAHNMGTSLSTVMPTTGAGMGGRGTGGGGRRNLETILKNAHAYTELNVSQFGRTDARRTRVGYKDRQKKSAFAQMTHAGDALNLHEAVVQRAKELFAGFRDDRELVQQFKGILAACLCEAFEQLSAEGKHILRQQQQMIDQQNQTNMGNANKDDAATTADGNSSNPNAAPTIMLSGRAARRSELHHATMAGKGGLLLNVPNTGIVATSATNTSGSSNGNIVAAIPAAEMKAVNDDEKKKERLAATWDLEHCRSWLLNACRNIAQIWVDERKKNPDSTTIPTGSVDELEGRLVEHAITLCEHLETELQSRSTSSTSAQQAVNRVVTPRIQDMSKLGIKWQHSHERGSGGKGGVGGSGITKSTTTGSAIVQSNKNNNNNNGSTRTAGQILLLKTSKKLGTLLNDPIAGEAFHRELRQVIAKQEAMKQKEMREEATRQRLNQMQRKPWLAAKVQQ